MHILGIARDSTDWLAFLELVVREGGREGGGDLCAMFESGYSISGILECRRTHCI